MPRAGTFLINNPHPGLAPGLDIQIQAESIVPVDGVPVLFPVHQHASYRHVQRLFLGHDVSSSLPGVVFYPDIVCVDPAMGIPLKSVLDRYMFANISSRPAQTIRPWSRFIFFMMEAVRSYPFLEKIVMVDEKQGFPQEHVNFRIHIVPWVSPQEQGEVFVAHHAEIEIVPDAVSMIGHVHRSRARMKGAEVIAGFQYSQGSGGISPLREGHHFLVLDAGRALVRIHPPVGQADFVFQYAFVVCGEFLVRVIAAVDADAEPVGPIPEQFGDFSIRPPVVPGDERDGGREIALVHGLQELPVLERAVLFLQHRVIDDQVGVYLLLVPCVFPECVSHEYQGRDELGKALSYAECVLQLRVDVGNGFACGDENGAPARFEHDKMGCPSMDMIGL